jgi:hypothetical protein
MADREDPGVDPMQATALDPVLGTTAPKTKVIELLQRDDTVLRSGERRDGQVDRASHDAKCRPPINAMDTQTATTARRRRGGLPQTSRRLLGAWARPPTHSVVIRARAQHRRTASATRARPATVRVAKRAHPSSGDRAAAAIGPPRQRGGRR